jgi:copper homeostasis protein
MPKSRITLGDDRRIMARVLMEICVEGIESALAASAGGADRIELCENLVIGGITPSTGAIAVVCRSVAIPVHVLIRPRGGNFIYSGAEFDAMRHDVEVAKAQGAAGVVVGMLRGDGSVDDERVARLTEVARPLSVTFHKAFDAARNVIEALDTLVSIGIDRVLTSGGCAKAVDAIETLTALRERAKSRVVIMPGGGIAARDLPVMIRAGFHEVHLGSAAMVGGRTDAAKVRELIELARRAPPG